MDPGFAIHERVLSVTECEALTREVSGDSIKRSRAGARHLMSNSIIAALASDDRLLTLARRSLGQGAVPYRATLFEKSGDSNWLVVWHQDTALPLAARFDEPEWQSWSEKSGVNYAHAPGVGIGAHFSAPSSSGCFDERQWAVASNSRLTRKGITE